MTYWIVKTEPGDWSWDMQLKAGKTYWDGVRNYQAAGNLRAMKVGDQCMFYHSVSEKRIVGMMEVIDTAIPDPKDPTGRFVMVEMKTLKSVPHPITLEQIKSDPALNHLALVRQSRLSVIPVDPAAWQHLLKLGGVEG